ncbi:hypothetical protein QYE77_15260 (plasmid) [Thermanaerothrix sp. 4228-RoL]|jgi:hypothetical protein|uniref:Uncharacterized protein n=1 Tax=Thermanaerothrix solaris TaxID=3058434 RepID=A0ABU3NS21_9CHLR|nr:MULTISPECIES: hypothetical protein [unclassified Thermanaerothrix]MDT8899623.1 hypothetical protein [Thermanaerothrix sp. 4228-RoL]
MGRRITAPHFRYEESIPLHIVIAIPQDGQPVISLWAAKSENEIIDNISAQDQYRGAWVAVISLFDLLREAASNDNEVTKIIREVKKYLL